MRAALQVEMACSSGSNAAQEVEDVVLTLDNVLQHISGTDASAACQLPFKGSLPKKQVLTVKKPAAAVLQQAQRPKTFV